MATLSPLLATGNPVDWWFAFKFNDETYPGNLKNEKSPGIFGGKPDDYKGGFCLSYAVASSANQTLTMGTNSIGTSVNDPLGATFNQVYNGSCYYVIWNDQFCKAPGKAPMETKDAPWGHSKGLLAWDDTGTGFVLQVSTPSWPASGSKDHPRKDDGNTLGCIKDDDVKVSQHFFALKLNVDDVAAVLKALANASVVTDPKNPQIVRNGGPANIKSLVDALGTEANFKKTTPSMVNLSTEGVRLISKPSGLPVPPWQMVSAMLGAVPLRVASWWTDPDEINSTTASTRIGCWDASLGEPGAVEIAISGTWGKKSIGLKGGPGKDCNHAKIGVSTATNLPLCIFGDMNQQGALNKADADKGCASSQNGRGGLFFVISQNGLHDSLASLLAGESAPA